MSEEHLNNELLEKLPIQEVTAYEFQGNLYRDHWSAEQARKALTAEVKDERVDHGFQVGDVAYYCTRRGVESGKVVELYEKTDWSWDEETNKNYLSLYNGVLVEGKEGCQSPYDWGALGSLKKDWREFLLFEGDKDESANA